LLAGRFAAAERLGKVLPPPPEVTALGAMLAHVTGGANAETYQPMNINFGLFPPPPERDERGKRIKGRDRKKFASDRARAALPAWLDEVNGLLSVAAE
jgi:methylenetetrahydrofolate--tRNA-(uracil-5-)-methyltransferase